MLNKYNVYIYDESSSVPLKRFIGVDYSDMADKVIAAAELDLLIVIEKAIVQDEGTGIKTEEEERTDGTNV